MRTWRWLGSVATGLGLAGAAAALGTARDAVAKTTIESAYTLEQTYNAALRLVRVDMGLKVTEKDEKAAYVLFEYKSREGGERTSPGSIEMVPSGQAVKVVVQLPQMPRYHEQVMADSLLKKMRTEYGDPPKRPPEREAGDDAPGG